MSCGELVYLPDNPAHSPLLQDKYGFSISSVPVAKRNGPLCHVVVIPQFDRKPCITIKKSVETQINLYVLRIVRVAGICTTCDFQKKKNLEVLCPLIESQIFKLFVSEVILLQKNPNIKFSNSKFKFKTTLLIPKGNQILL